MLVVYEHGMIQIIMQSGRKSHEIVKGTYAVRNLKEGAAERDSMDRPSSLLIPARDDQSCLQHILQHTRFASAAKL